jgi:HPt (histidine-containing phosphotransfer) domain-containing protein
LTSPNILLVEEDPVRACRVTAVLSGTSQKVLWVRDGEGAKEALALRQFDVVMISSPSPASVAEEIRPVTRHRNPPVLLLVLGDASDGPPPGLCDALISRSTPDSELPGEISLAIRAAQGNLSAAMSQSSSFDLLAFRDQLDQDTELMSEIVSLFLEESATQLRDLRAAVTSNDHNRVSCIAHSLKGSLGTLYAARARHWAQMLEEAALAQDCDRGRYSLLSLEESIAALRPELQKLL